LILFFFFFYVFFFFPFLYTQSFSFSFGINVSQEPAWFFTLSRKAFSAFSVLMDDDGIRYSYLVVDGPDINFIAEIVKSGNSVPA
jgi:hypothetical protein